MRKILLGLVVFYLGALVGFAALSADNHQGGENTHQHMMPMEQQHEYEN
jgi:hypothetical protein